MASNSEKYKDYSREELIDELETLKKKKYGLVWDKKNSQEMLDAFVNWENVPENFMPKKFPVLKEVKNKEIENDKDKPVNLLIEGDNYHSLAVLNFTHQNKIDVIYIDPPYNTGARDWKYNNNFVDITDPYRHSKWLSLMHKRLLLSKNLLKDDGIICITIDDNEMAPLWMLMNEVFDEFCHLGTVVIRNNPKGRMTNRKISLTHEYALFFGKSPTATIKKLPVPPEDKTHNYIQDKDGSWYLPVNLRKQGVDSNAINRKGKLSDRFFPIFFDPDSKKISSKKKLKIEILPIDAQGVKRIWRRGTEAIDNMCELGDLWAKKVNGEYQLYYKFRGGLEGQMPKSIWYEAKYSASEYGTKTLDSIMGARETFQYPKSPYAVRDCILACSNNKDAIILDFFAGSGTTSQAVLELNKEDEGGRKFILCTNNENNICTDVCYPRVEKVINGYKNSKGEKVPGLGGNLKYFKTDFVGSDSTDKNRRDLVNKSAEMICIKEDIFDLAVDKGQDFKIYQKGKKFLGVIFDIDAIADFKKEAEKHKGNFVVYCFSYTEATPEKEFKGLKNKYILKPIPAVILRIYLEIFKK